MLCHAALAVVASAKTGLYPPTAPIVRRNALSTRVVAIVSLRALCLAWRRRWRWRWRGSRRGRGRGSRRGRGRGVFRDTALAVGSVAETVFHPSIALVVDTYATTSFVMACVGLGARLARWGWRQTALSARSVIILRIEIAQARFIESEPLAPAIVACFV